MDLSVLVAKIMAITYFSVGIAAILGAVKFSEIIEDLEKSPALIYVLGIISLILGMLLVENHNLWVKDWRVLITIVGWGAIIKGVLFLVFPKILTGMKAWYQNSCLLGCIVLVLGLLMGYFGFFN